MNEKQAAVEINAWWRGASGPTNARLYHMCLAACALVAWLSLGSQVQLLIGSRGLRRRRKAQGFSGNESHGVRL